MWWKLYIATKKRLDQHSTAFLCPMFFLCAMTPEFSINVQEVEQLQTVGDTGALEQLFEKARRMVIGGGSVVLERVSPGGEVSRFDSITSEADLETYRRQVFRYL